MVRIFLVVAALVILPACKLLEKPKPDYMITERTVAEALLQNGWLPKDPGWQPATALALVSASIPVRQEVIRSARNVTRDIMAQLVRQRVRGEEVWNGEKNERGYWSPRCLDDYAETKAVEDVANDVLDEWKQLENIRDLTDQEVWDLIQRKMSRKERDDMIRSLFKPSSQWIEEFGLRTFNRICPSQWVKSTKPPKPDRPCTVQERAQLTNLKDCYL